MEVPNTTTMARPGQMTAVMRAMAMASGPKVLRIGVVHAGRVIEERIIKQRTAVTIGSSEKSMFVIPSQAVPPSFRLFERIGNDYHLNFTDGMTGRVALATGIADIASLRGQAKKVGNAYQVKLTEEARGKVVVGETTFVFQFVAPPPVAPRPQLPLAVKGGLASQIDWSLTIIAAFSFMVHFGFVGAMYSDWTDPILSDDSSVAGLVDMMKNIPAPPPVEVPTAAATGTVAPTSTAAATKPAGPTAPTAPTAPTGPTGPNAAVGDVTAAKMAAEVERMNFQMLISLNGGTSVDTALRRDSNIPPVDLSGPAGANIGASPGSGELHFGAGGAPIRGSKSGGIAGIGGVTTAQAIASAGPEQKFAGPVAVAQVGGTTMTAPVSDADRVIAGLRTRFRACYQAGLNSDPSMSGKVTISAKVGPNGEVSSADVANNTGLSASVSGCIAKTVRNAQFSAPGGNGSTINVPVTFVQQGK